MMETHTSSSAPFRRPAYQAKRKFPPPLASPFSSLAVTRLSGVVVLECFFVSCFLFLFSFLFFAGSVDIHAYKHTDGQADRPKINRLDSRPSPPWSGSGVGQLGFQAACRVGLSLLCQVPCRVSLVSPAS